MKTQFILIAVLSFLHFCPVLSKVPFSFAVCSGGLDLYARWFADSEMKRFPQAYQLDHGKRLYFGYAQGVGCCAMLRMWKATGELCYYDYVKQWADSLINEKGEIHRYDKAAYNLDFINSGKVLFDLYRETGDLRYRKAMDLLVAQLRNQPRILQGGFWHKLIYQHQMWLDGLYMVSPFMAQYGKEFNAPEWIDEAVKQFRLCHEHTYDVKTGWYHQPERKGNFPEASVTTQCMYAYAKAVNQGYIDASYRQVAEKAFEGLKAKLLVENQDGMLTLTRCCQVGGLGGKPYRDGSFEYYIGEKMRDNDAKATGPFIMACLELKNKSKYSFDMQFIQKHNHRRLCVWILSQCAHLWQ